MQTSRIERIYKTRLALSKSEPLHKLHLYNPCTHFYYRTHEFKYNILIKIVIEIQSIIAILNYEPN